jgi:ribosomal protein L39E
MFYVYVYKDPRPTKNLQVVYVGKGKGQRLVEHQGMKVHNNKGFGNFLSLLRRLELKPIVEIVAEFEDEAEAFFEEIKLIALYGRRDTKTGTLFNLTDGGEGGSGHIKSALEIARIKERVKSMWADPEYREATTAAIRKAISSPDVIARREAAKKVFQSTPEWLETMKQATTEMWQNPEYAEKVRLAQLEAQNTPRAKQVKSINSKIMWSDPEVADKIAKGIKATRSTEESRAKTQEKSKSMWADPEYRRLQTERNREIANRPEVKAAKAAALKARMARKAKQNPT